MRNPLPTTRDGTFRTLHVAALVLCAVMLPWSTAFLSIAQMLLAANWIVEGLVRGTMKARLKAAFGSTATLVFLSFFALHLLGLLWTDDMTWGTDLGRILFPVLVFGIILSGSDRLSGGELRTILLFGAWSAVSSGLFGLVFSGAEQGDYRGLSMFISHIRLALLLCLAVAIFLYHRPVSLWLWCAQLTAAIVAMYLIGRLGSLQGLVILGCMALAVIWRRMAHAPLRWKLLVRSALIALPIVSLIGIAVLIEARHTPIPPGLGRQIEYTAGGEPYFHDTTNTQTENGTHVWTYISWLELRRNWPLRSQRSLDAPDAKGHPLWSTAVRYMASKGLRKDSVGVMALSDEDIRAIERGIPNVLYGKRGRVRERVDEVLFELDMYRSRGAASGHSVAMRIEFLKAGWALARENWLCGVGTGDTPEAFDTYYTETHSSLELQWRLRAHNEYLTLAISFGVFGLLWSLFSWLWPAYRLGAWRHPLFIGWAIAFGISCLTDDTIETQAGATFFALYYTLFVFAAPLKGNPPADRAHAEPGSA